MEEYDQLEIELKRIYAIYIERFRNLQVVGFFSVAGSDIVVGYSCFQSIDCFVPSVSRKRTEHLS